MEQAVFAAGCFWGVEDSFRKLPGVTATAVGYCGGQKIDPTYEQVCTGRTGHAEAVVVEYDPVTLSYEDLLLHFWGMHDPTQVNRQGPDHGTQYRSAIFTQSEAQHRLAVTSKQNQIKQHVKPIATEILPLAAFYMAEDYHQQYVEKQYRTSMMQR